MDHQNNNDTILDGDIGFVWEEALSDSDKNNFNTNSDCPTPTSGQVQKAAVAAEEKRRVVRNGKQPAASGGGAGKDGGNDAAAGGGGGGDHELHIWTERERRKKMRCMFTELQELLPQAPSKPDKSTIVDEAVNYIKVLQQKHTSLQRQKLEMFQGHSSTYDPVGSMDSSSREAFVADQGSSGHQDYQMLSSGNPLSGAARYATAFKTWTAPNMVLSVCGDKAQISICCPKRAGLFGAICFFLEKYKLQVLYATVACDQFRSMFMIQAYASGGVDQVSEASLSVEDLFQLAMGEIMMHISTMM